MEKNRLKGDAVLLLTAAIWGFAFVAQRAGMQYMGPFSFNGIRFSLGAFSLLPLLIFHYSPIGKGLWLYKPELVKGGVLLGLLIFAGGSLQQIGVVYTSAGKAGFITGLYVIFVPIMGMFFKKKTPLIIWMAAILAVTGMYFLSVTSEFTIGKGDFLVLLSAFFWAGHVLAIGHFTGQMDALPLAFIQFLVCAVLSLITGFFVEEISLMALQGAMLPILYAGVMSVGVAYTLQVVGQKYAAPAPAAIILSLEAVFAVLGGWLLLNEALSLREIIGAVLMLSGMIISQLPGFSHRMQGKL